MKKAWTENGFIRDIAQGDPKELFHPDVAALYATDVPDDAVVGAALVGGEWVVPHTERAAVEPTTSYPKIGPIAFKMLFAASERIKAKQLRASDEILEDFWGLLDDPRTDTVDLGLASVQAAVEYTLHAVKVAGVDIDVAARKAEILAGQVQ